MKTLRKILLCGLMAFTMGLSACGPAANPEKIEYVQVVEGGTLDDKLETTTEETDATIILVRDVEVDYIFDGYEIGYGLTRQIKSLVVRPVTGDKLLTFLYLGNRPFDEGHVTIYYRPVKPGEVITNNDIVAKIISNDCVLPDSLNYIIEGYYGPASITGITGSELPEGGVVYKDK